MRLSHYAPLGLLLAVTPQLGLAAPVFTDTFNSTASSASYVAVATNSATSFPTYAWDYFSALGIPSAPHSGDGSTLGLKLDANVSGGAISALTLHTLATYSGDYTVQFDAWINVNGPFPDGGTGSTNYLTAGVGGDGATINRLSSSGASNAVSGVGAWTAVNGENGNGNDYRLYKGITTQDPSTGQYAAGSRDGTNLYYSSFGSLNISNFPVQGVNNGGPAQQDGVSGIGTFGMAWHQVLLVVDSDGGTGGAPSVKWYIDNLLIGTLDAGANGSFSPNGSVTLGYADPTANLSDNPPLSFALIDNLVIDVVPEPATLSLLTLAALPLASRRCRA